MAEHKLAVQTVLARLMDHDFAVNLPKSEFHVRRVNILDYVFGEDTLEMEQGKIQTLQDWEVHTRTKDVQAFLSCANYYRRFIRDYATRVKPLTELTI